MNFAIQQLAHYFSIVTDGEECEIQLCCDNNGHGDDDYYKIDVVAGKGYIKGADKKSVLLGVCAFFRELGYRFFSPVEEGEKPIKLAKKDCTVSLERRYELRHRGIVIEGAVSKEHIAAILDWSAKNGLNSYFMQFVNSYEFLERWYKHEYNPFLESEPFNEEIAETYFQDVVKEIGKRDFHYHGVGHGWTCEAIKVLPKGWYTVSSDDLLEENRELLAMIDGKRDFFNGVPLNTNLCYSKLAAREKITTLICDYAETHKDVHYLHFWLADNFNNFCECEECAKLLPADWYVKMLNELDEKLTQKGLKTKIVFLIYFDLFFPPKYEKIKNPDRFVLMFAPVTRDYHESFSDVCDMQAKEFHTDYILNKNKFERGIKNNVAFLKEWQKDFKGDSFVFDYPLMWEIYRDLSGIRLSKVIYDDIVGLKKLGLNGYMSCQVNRNFFPTAFPMYVIAKTCEDVSVSFNVLLTEYFSKEFGEEKDTVIEFLTKLSNSSIVKYLDGTCKDKTIIDEIDQLMPYLNRMENLFISNESDIINGRNFRKLHLFVDFYKDVCKLIKDKENGVDEETLKTFVKEASKKIYAIEAEFSYELDGNYYYTCLNNIIG